MSTIHKKLTRCGYVLDKKLLSQKELDKVKKDLEVTPKVNSDYTAQVESFKIYIEYDDYLCVPRYYGTEHFGPPTIPKSPKSNKMDIVFNGSLRDNQKPVINKCLESIKRDGGGIISLPCGFGKCLAKGTPILMYDGFIKLVEYIKVGDKIMGDDSRVRNVLSLARGVEQMYDIYYEDGHKYTVNESHILSLKYIGTNTIIINGKKLDNNSVLDINVVDYLKISNEIKGLFKGFRATIDFNYQHITIDPYIIGLWIGHQGGKSTRDCKDFIKYNNVNIFLEHFMDEIKKLNIFCEYPNIPHNYKCNSPYILSAVLAGIFDADYDEDSNIGSINESVVDDIMFIARSLGFKTIKKRNTIYNHTSFELEITGNLSTIPVRETKLVSTMNDVTIYDIDVKPAQFDTYYGFQIDGNHRFVLGDFTVTHNTTISLYLAQQLGLRTLVVVHKSFLQNQWYDRIKQFTNAKIGMIRQNKVDVEGKDIVIAMLHSISMRDYDLEIFNKFDTVIFDECFIRREKVLTDNGPISIGKLYDMWESNKILPLIKSFNESTGQFEYKKMTYAWKKKAMLLIVINIDSREIICTPNHKFLTTSGYKEACNLTQNDLLIGNDNSTKCIAGIGYIKMEEKHSRWVYDIEVQDNHNFIIGHTTLNAFSPVVHNCHHLAAKVFSRAMVKTGGIYTIGLSATPTRSDGLSHVIQWHLGDLLYRIERKGDKGVIVKSFNYETIDPNFVEKKQRINRKTVLSIPRMITNIGNINSRNKFIVDILSTLKDEDGRKILVLSNRIAHLELLKEQLDAIINKEIKDNKLVEGEIKTAFYIGKMKEYQLDDSADADIIFGSYAMAEEGLDIDKLNTLVLATPKKNIVQSIGRILRKPIEEGDINPLIVDIVDDFSIFSVWGRARLDHYNKEKYTISNYHAYNDSCVTIKDYLVMKGAISKDDNDADINIRKEYTCYRFGNDAWELQQDLMSEDAKEIMNSEKELKKYKYDPNLKTILKINNEFGNDEIVVGVDENNNDIKMSKKYKDCRVQVIHELNDTNANAEDIFVKPKKSVKTGKKLKK